MFKNPNIFHNFESTLLTLWNPFENKWTDEAAWYCKRKCIKN